MFDGELVQSEDACRENDLVLQTRPGAVHFYR